MFDFHKDKKRYFEFQYLTSRDYVIPFMFGKEELDPDMKVLEIGCGEAGVLKAFYEKGIDCTGIELSPSRIKRAKALFEELPRNGSIEFIVRNIFDIDPKKDLRHQYDLIILKDVIEHIPNQQTFLLALKSFLKPDGKVFMGFPPWQMPFGGHQQITNSKWTKFPYIHLLPKGLYKWLLRNQVEHTRVELLELKETGLSIEHFERIVGDTGFSIVDRKLFLFNPIYKYKFGFKPRKQLKLIASIPYLRNYLTTCAYYHLKFIDNK